MYSKEEYVQEAEKFIKVHHQDKWYEKKLNRLESIREQIYSEGTWTPTKDELKKGGQMAWRNSSRCIGRLFHMSLNVKDKRNLTDENEIFEALVEHLQEATNEGRIKPVMTVFRERRKGEEIRIWNKQLVRYAGFENDGVITGDPAEVEFTNKCIGLGWKPKRTAFELLPIVIQIGNREPKWFELPRKSVLEVKITHPELHFFEELQLKWYAVPVITDMAFRMAGLEYTAAPFSGWYMGTEIAARNLADENRYNMLPVVAKKMGLSTNSRHDLWKDRALLEINRAVLYSFKKAGVMITDHHTASRQFMKFCTREKEAGREVMADWSWIVPPMSASTMEVFHKQWQDNVSDPNFYYQEKKWKKTAGKKLNGCPYYLNSN
ncbi:nitric oxide synthase oxygenase [Gracilimonas halophila]|uniref:Nitric oxide synthase oxygenase n=1 Tax=Gracilimonas halophila TaxID=1834464 RepID=A0ABW5JG55_9BACT